MPTAVDMFCAAGNAALDAMDMALPYTVRVESLRDLIEVYDREVAMLERLIHLELADHAGYWAIQAIPGVGQTMGAIFVAEIGDVSRFSAAEKLCSWAGLTPKHRESDIKVTRGRVTKAGSRLVRWAAIEAVANPRTATHLRADFHRLAERRGPLGEHGRGGRLGGCGPGEHSDPAIQSLTPMALDPSEDRRARAGCCRGHERPGRRRRPRRLSATESTVRRPPRAVRLL